MSSKFLNKNGKIRTLPPSPLTTASRTGDPDDACSNGRIMELSSLLEPSDLDNRPSLCKRKDFLEIEPEAKSHPNRTYYYRKHHDTDKIIDSCSRKLQVGTEIDCWMDHQFFCPGSRIKSLTSSILFVHAIHFISWSVIILEPFS